MLDIKEKEQTESRHYIFLVFLILLNVMNFVDRQLLASFANFIIPDLSLSNTQFGILTGCLLYTSPSPRDAHESRMPSSA